MGSDESHFNVSVGSDGQSHKTVSTNHNLFEEKGSRSGIEPRSFRLPALRLTAKPNQLTKYVASFHSLISTHADLSGGADSVDGPPRRGKECPFSGVTSYGSLEEGAGKRCSECRVTI